MACCEQACDGPIKTEHINDNDETEGVYIDNICKRNIVKYHLVLLLKKYAQWLEVSPFLFTDECVRNLIEGPRGPGPPNVPEPGPWCICGWDFVMIWLSFLDKHTLRKTKRHSDEHNCPKNSFDFVKVYLILNGFFICAIRRVSIVCPGSLLYIHVYHCKAMSEYISIIYLAFTVISQHLYLHSSIQGLWRLAK